MAIIESKLESIINLADLFRVVDDFMKENNFFLAPNYLYDRKTNEIMIWVKEDEEIGFPKDAYEKGIAFTYDTKGNEGMLNIAIKKANKFPNILLVGKINQFLNGQIWGKIENINNNLILNFTYPIHLDSDKTIKPKLFEIVSEIAIHQNRWPIFPRIPADYYVDRTEDGEIFNLTYVCGLSELKEKGFRILKKYYGNPLVFKGDIITPAFEVPNIVSALRFVSGECIGESLAKFTAKDVAEGIIQSMQKRWNPNYPGTNLAIGYLYGKHHNNLTQVCRIRDNSGYGLSATPAMAFMDFCDVYWHDAKESFSTKINVRKSIIK